MFNTIKRQEKKYLITEEVRQNYIYRLKQCLKEDTHNNANGYLIRSLYFDTLDDSDYYEKLEGVELRKKIRLRIYNTNDDYAQLEMKQKQNIYQLKRSIKISRKDAEEMSQGNYISLLNYNEPFAAECYALMNLQCYRPKTIVEYQRTAFIAQENSIRVTFDRNIRSTESSTDIFSDKLQTLPAMPPYNSVMEVKYDGFLLSYIKDMLNEIDRSKLSLSKYCLGRVM